MQLLPSWKSNCIKGEGGWGIVTLYSMPLQSLDLRHHPCFDWRSLSVLIEDHSLFITHSQSMNFGNSIFKSGCRSLDIWFGFSPASRSCAWNFFLSLPSKLGGQGSPNETHAFLWSLHKWTYLLFVPKFMIMIRRAATVPSLGQACSTRLFRPPSWLHVNLLWILVHAVTQ